jgi:DNA-binding transcriptional ArsR family regulator
MNYAFRASRMYRTKRENLGTNGLSQRRHALVSVAREMVAHARRRRQFLPDAVFQDPQWMMTLDLFIASEEGREVSVSSLCCASGVPPTTALRHIRYLQEQGILERFSHPNDKRISLVRLAEASRSQLARYLASIGSDLGTGGKHSASGQTY